MILEIRDLRKEFDGIVAIDGLDFSMEKGTIRAIIGPNGAGKTTFFNLITASLAADSGTIAFKGEDITGKSISEIAKKGIVRKFQTPSVWDELTVEENLTVAVDPSRVDDPKENIRKAIDYINLNDRLDDKAKSLDHGSKQWLEIGMILATDPDLLLLDEPTAGMTVEETNRTIELIKSFNKSEGTSVIAIEHDISFIRGLDSRLTVFHQGSVLAEGSIDEIERDEEVQRVYLGEGHNVTN
jgi:urea ABC transporter ATP-binding protein UrtD